MVNVTEAKYDLAGVRANRIDVLKSTSELFKPPAVTDYEKKKAEEKARIHNEIKRVLGDSEFLDN